MAEGAGSSMTAAATSAAAEIMFQDSRRRMSVSHSRPSERASATSSNNQLNKRKTYPLNTEVQTPGLLETTASLSSAIPHTHTHTMCSFAATLPVTRTLVIALLPRPALILHPPTLRAAVQTSCVFAPLLCIPCLHVLSCGQTTRFFLSSKSTRC